MTAAACKAVYSDWKLIRTRSCVQIVFEIPVEQAGEAYDALGGMPDPSKSVWCAIARMSVAGAGGTTAGHPTPLRNEDGSRNPGGGDVTEPQGSTNESKQKEGGPDEPAPARSRKSWHEMTPAQQAGILANDHKFQRFVLERGTFGNERIVEQNAEGAAEFIRLSCAVSSRADILPGSNHAALWDALVSRFRAWDRAPSVGAA